MADINPTNPQQHPEGMRKLKKIKRPIKRFVPNNPSTPATPSVSTASGAQSRRLNNPSNASLDELLDSQLNLPTLNSGIKVSSSDNEIKKERDNNFRRPSRFLSEDDFAPKLRFMDQLMEGNLFTLKGVAVIAVLVFLVGFLAAKIFTGGKTVVKDGLQGVVVNAEVPRGRARCGVAERTQGCVLYIMNPQRQDLQGRDFSDLASQLTGRQRFVVETGNMRYSNTKVRPGDIAQINIPPLQ